MVDVVNSADMNSEFDENTVPVDITAPHTEDPLVGRVLDGRYQVESILGSGGMGSVYRARHVEIGKEVAIKVLHPQFSIDPKIVNRFAQEIEVMSGLAHPNIITIQDIGTTPYKTPYFVMEYLNCLSLQDVIENDGPIKVDDALPILQQIAEALDHAHCQGIVHRDLKPANVLLIPSADRLFVKIVDLGIAKAVQPDGASAQDQLTQTGEIFGSPQYMSPEQCGGEPQDKRTDVYAFGCLIYSMLTGRAPFVEKSPMLVIFSHLNDKPPKFSEISTRNIQAPKTASLEAMALKCLEKDPDNRYQSMSELLTDLRAISRGDTKDISIRKPTQEIIKENIGNISKPVESVKVRNFILITLALFIFGLGGLGAFWLLPKLQSLMVQNSTGQPSSNYATNIGPSVNNGITYDPNKTPEDYLNDAFNNMNHKVFSKEFAPYPGDTKTVRVLSVYNGKPTGRYTEIFPGRVNVNVKAHDNNLVLVLNAFMPTTWRVNRSDPGVKIQEVIAVGYFPQKVEGLPQDVKITRVFILNEDKTLRKDRDKLNKFEPWSAFLYSAGDNVFSGNDFKSMQKVLLKYTGNHVRTFDGTRATDRFNLI